MAGAPPGPQQGQPPPGGAPGGMPNIPPELLMVLLSHLAVSGGQSTQQPGAPGQPGQQAKPPPKDGSQVPSLGDILPGILQALMGTQAPPPAAGQPGVVQAPQGAQQQGQQKPQPDQSNPLQSILQSLGIKLQ